jgi:hypothetical protein
LPSLFANHAATGKQVWWRIARGMSKLAAASGCFFQHLSRAQINAVQRGDDFATREQLLQIGATAELFVAKNPLPKIWSGDAKFRLAERICCGIHAGLFSAHGAAPKIDRYVQVSIFWSALIPLI